MSGSGGCPRAAELVGLLGPRDLAPAAAAELRRHAAGCAACGEELRLLEETFLALAPPPAPGALDRIEAAVLPVVAADLGGAAHRPPPARVPAAPRRPGWGRLALCSVAVVAWALGLGALPWQPDGGGALRPLPGALLLLVAPAALLSLSLEGRRWLALAAAGTAAAALVLGAARGTGVGTGGAGCVLLGVLGAIVPAGLLYGLLGTARRGALGGAALGLAAWCAGLSLQSALCPGRWPLHVLTMHLLPAALAVAACAGLGWLAGALGARREKARAL